MVHAGAEVEEQRLSARSESSRLAPLERREKRGAAHLRRLAELERGHAPEQRDGGAALDAPRARMLALGEIVPKLSHTLTVTTIRAWCTTWQ